MKRRRKHISAKVNENKKGVDKSDSICYRILGTGSACAVSVNVGLTVPNNVSLSTKLLIFFLMYHKKNIRKNGFIFFIIAYFVI